MNILVACEESQAVTIELRKLGHNAFSCDIEPQSGGHDEWHVQADVLPLLNGRCEFSTVDGVSHMVVDRWDMIIAFPPCTHLAVSGARHFDKKRKDGRQQQGIEFFMNFINADCDKISVENPIGIISGDYISTHFIELQNKYNFPIKQTQIIQPYQFGHQVQKATCLWLKGLPKLKPTEIVDKGEFYISPTGKKIHVFHNKNINSSKNRQSSRSVTFLGIAHAMATQWAGNA